MFPDAALCFTFMTGFTGPQAICGAVAGFVTVKSSAIRYLLHFRDSRATVHRFV
jgi:hypothetical protein